MSLCKYQNILGKPGVGFHNHFGMGFAVLDLAATIGVAYLITQKTRYRSFPKVFGGIMLTAITVHRIFGVNTVLNNYLFGSSECPVS